MILVSGIFLVPAGLTVLALTMKAPIPLLSPIYPVREEILGVQAEATSGQFLIVSSQPTFDNLYAGLWSLQDGGAGCLNKVQQPH